MSITIIGAGLGGLIVGSGSTFYLLNPRIRQAEAEKAALSAQLNTVTEQLHRLQRQVAALQYQVSHPPLDRAEPVPALTEEPVAASVKLPQPPAPSLEEEAAVLFALHVARPADQLPADAAEMMPMPPAADAGELGSESLELEVLTDIPDPSLMAMAPEFESPVADLDLDPPRIESPWCLEANPDPVAAQADSAAAMDATLDFTEMLSDSQATSAPATTPHDSFPQDISPFLTPEEPALDLAASRPEQRGSQIPEFLSTDLPFEPSPREPLVEELGSAVPARALGKMPPLHPFDLGSDPEATWIQPDSEGLEMTAAELALEISPLTRLNEEPEAVIPVIDLGKENDFSAFLGADPEATWVYSEQEE